MTHQRTPDDQIHGWLMSGPETASSDLVERTLRPVPRMRQRRSWRIALERFVAPVASPAVALVSVIVVVAGIGLFAVLGGLGGVVAGPSSPSPLPSPSFTLTVSEGPDGHVSAGIGTYVNDPATALNLCTHATDGSWRYLYGGGDPYVNIDLLVGAGAGTAGSGQVAMELSAGKGYIRFDPTQLRGGDEPGRSTATIVVTPGPSTTSFDVTAVTPDKNTADDIAKVSVHLSLTCPN